MDNFAANLWDILLAPRYSLLNVIITLVAYLLICGLIEGFKKVPEKVPEKASLEEVVCGSRAEGIVNLARTSRKRKWGE